MGFTERAARVGWGVINADTDPGKWANICQEGPPHARPALVKEMREARPLQRAGQSHGTGEEGSPCLLPTLSRNPGITTTGGIPRFGFGGKWVLPRARSPLWLRGLLLPFHWVISFTFALKLLVFPHRSFLCFVFCAQQAVCGITLDGSQPRMKNKRPPVSALPSN